MLIRGSRAEIAAFTLVVLTITACSPVWFLTRSDEIVLPLRLEDGLSQSVSFVPKFPRRRYGLFLRFDRTVSFEDMECLVGYLMVDNCPTATPVPVTLRWVVSMRDVIVVQGTAVPRFSNVGWADDFVEIMLGDFYPESETTYDVSTRVIGNGGRLADLRPKLLVLSYYNPLDKSIHVRPGSDLQPLPNFRIHPAAFGRG
jgi:hypothetical protein